MDLLIIRNAQQYLNDSRIQLALENKNFMDMNTFIKITEFGINEGFDKLFNPEFDREIVRADLKHRLEDDYYLMIEELMGLYCAYTLLTSFYF